MTQGDKGDSSFFFDTGAGQYDVIEELARGGMGAVMRGRDRTLNRKIAIKVLLPKHVGNLRLERRFIEEAQIGGQLQHPGIVPVYDLGRLEDRRPYFAMKLIQGRTLAEMLDERDDPGDARGELLGVFERICQTVAYAHARGVIHRDLKPANMMVGAFGEVQIVDWGLAKVLPQGDHPVDTGDNADRVAMDDSVEMTDEEYRASIEREYEAEYRSGTLSEVRTVRTDPSSGDSDSLEGAILGSPAYMPPEQAKGRLDQVDERADVFALGAILGEILTGQPPYESSDMAPIHAARAGKLDGIVAALHACEADESLVALACRCLSKDRDARPRHAGVLADELVAYIASNEARALEAQIVAARAQVEARAERSARRLTTALAISVMLAFAIGGLAFLWIQRERQEQRLQQTGEVQSAMQRAGTLLGEARRAPVGDLEVWGQLTSARDRLRDLTEGADVAAATRRSSIELDAAIEKTLRDRRMRDKLEDLLITGASNLDSTSWRQMETNYAAAFREYGVDVLATPADEVIRRLAASDIRIELADALELWMSTRQMVNAFGHGLEAPDESKRVTDHFLTIIFGVDPDPFRTERRRLHYLAPRDNNALRDLIDEADFTTISPRSISWLGTAAGSHGDSAAVMEVFRRGLLLYPDDTMLHFDFAFNNFTLQRWEVAARHFYAAIALRRQTSGLWRYYGNCLRQIGDLEGSSDALGKAIELEPEHAPIHIDHGVTLAAMGRTDDAVAAYRRALELDPDNLLAIGRLGLTLENKGADARAEAARLLTRCHALGVDVGRWSMAYSAWFPERSRHIDELVWWKRSATPGQR